MIEEPRKILEITQEIPIHNHKITVSFKGDSRAITLFASDLYQMVNKNYIATNKLKPAEVKVFD
jgi:hypothetical protein